MSDHRIQGEITRIIQSRETQEVIGFEIMDGDKATNPKTGQSWNPVVTVWGSGELPPIGSIITVTGKQWYTTTSEYQAQPALGEPITKISKRDNLREITNLEVIGKPKPATVEETAQAIQEIAATTGKDLPF